MEKNSIVSFCDAVYESKTKFKLNHVEFVGSLEFIKAEYTTSVIKESEKEEKNESKGIDSETKKI